MTPSAASQQLRTLPHLGTLNFPPADLDVRQGLIRVVENSTLDRTYEARRNALIPKATLEANILTTAQIGGSAYVQEWNRHFLGRMTVLAKGI